MNPLLAALMTCLLVGPLVALTSRAGITCSCLSLFSTCWYFSRRYRYTGVVRTGWTFTLDKWQWKDMKRQIGWSRLPAATEISSQQGNANTDKYRFSRFSQSQGAMRPPG
jgi:hypothetical protein